MKALGIVGIIVAIAAVGFNIYALVETLPNYESMDARIAAEGVMTEFDLPLLEEYRDALKLQAYASLGLGLLGAILGGVGAVKGEFKPAWAAVLLGVGAAVLQFTWAV